MAGSENNSYTCECDEPECGNKAVGTLADIQDPVWFNWFFKVVDGNGVPTECYCDEHRHLHE